MIKRLLVFSAFVLSLNAFAQVSHGGQPFNWSDKHVSASIPVEIMPGIDVNALAAEDAVVDQYKEAPFRFGFEHETHLTLANAGEWKNLGNGKMVWQLGIQCPGARSMNFKFEDFYLPKGAELYLWAADREEYMGAFNHLNNLDSRVLTTSILHTDYSVIEVIVDANVADQVSFEITQVVHGYSV
jgi:lysyl endopeptidase